MKDSEFKEYALAGSQVTGTPPFGTLVGLCMLSGPFIPHHWYMQPALLVAIPLATVFPGIIV